MNSTLIVSGVCDNIVYRWVLLALYRENIHIKHIEEKQDGLVIQASDQQDDMCEVFKRIKGEILHAECDLKLELTSY